MKYWTIGYVLGGVVYAQVCVFCAKINDRYISELNCICNTGWNLPINVWNYHDGKFERLLLIKDMSIFILELG